MLDLSLAIDGFRISAHNQLERARSEPTNDMAEAQDNIREAAMHIYNHYLDEHAPTRVTFDAALLKYGVEIVHRGYTLSL